MALLILVCLFVKNTFSAGTVLVAQDRKSFIMFLLIGSNGLSE